MEILAAAAVSNALVLGSFIRDRGVKKQRYRFDSVGGNSSLDRAGTCTRPRTLTAQTWGSDASLAGELGMRMRPDLEEQQTAPARPRPAPLALPLASHAKAITPSIVQANCGFSGRGGSEIDPRDTQDMNGNVRQPAISPCDVEVITPRRTSFFDVGGLLDDHETGPLRQRRPEQTIPEITPAPLPPDGFGETVDTPQMDTSAAAFPQPRQASGVMRNFSRPTSPVQHGAQVPQSLPSLVSDGGSQKEAQRKPAHTLGSASPSFRDVGGLLD